VAVAVANDVNSPDRLEASDQFHLL
jgi:hypothetical protein